MGLKNLEHSHAVTLLNTLNKTKIANDLLQSRDLLIQK